MSRPAFLIVLFVALLGCQARHAVREPSIGQILEQATLTGEEKTKLVLTVNKDKIIMLSKKIGYYSGVLSVPVTLTNNSPDTLKYVSMDCSSEDIYYSNNITIVETDTFYCFKNWQIIKILPPGKSITTSVLFIKGKEFSPENRSFRVGMKLQKSTSIADNYNITILTDAARVWLMGATTIWSDEIEWPTFMLLPKKVSKNYW